MAYTTIDNPGLFFNTVLYTGANKSITGVNFQPDWVWIKERDSGYHAIFDSIRGATKILSSNVTNAESTQSDTLTSFDSDGFTLGADSSNYVGGSSTSTVSWNWLAGTSFSNDASATGIGTIDSSGSVSDAAGFSIVSYTGNSTSGASIKHGLSSAVKFVVGKAINTSGEDWYTGHASNGFDKYIKLNDTHAAQTFSGVFNDTAPNTSIVTLGSNGIINSSSYNYIMYCFAEKKGYSKFGSYTGNGNADGAFVYTGFRPAWVMIKRSSAAQSWILYDNKRSSFNTTNDLLFANTSGAESADNSVGIDFLSNGFKCRSADDSINSGTYIYMAFAEAPFVTAGTKAAGTAR